MIKENLLRAAMAEAGMKMPQLAELLGMSLSSLYKKMHGDSDFTRTEIQDFAAIFGWKKTNSIFFDAKETKTKKE